MRIACASALVCASLSAVACTPVARTPVVDPAVERTTLLDTERSFAADSVRRGADLAFDAFLAEDAVELADPSAPPIHGRSAIVATLHSKPGDQRFTLRWTPEDAAVSKSGDLGYTWGTYELTAPGKDTATPSVTHGRYLTIWRKEVGGRWRAIVDIGNK